MHRLLLLSAVLLVLPLGAQAQADRGTVHLDVGERAAASESGTYIDPVSYDRGGVTITQTPFVFVEGGGVSCGDVNGTYTTANSYWRVFDLSTYPEITDVFNVMEAGVGMATGEWFPEIPPQTTIVNLYTLSVPPANDMFLIEDLTLVGTAEYEYDGNVIGAEVVDVPVTGTFANTDLMVVEWFTPSGNPDDNPTIPAGSYFDLRAGINGEGQTAPNYLSAESCGITDPVTAAALGFPTNYWVLTVTGTVGGVSNEDGAVARQLTLGDAYPNPAAGLTVIPFTLEEPSQIEVALYDVRGREVAVVASGLFTAGEQSVSFDASALPSGTYVYRVNADGQVLAQQMVVLH